MRGLVTPVPATVAMLVDGVLQGAGGRLVELSRSGALIEVSDPDLTRRSGSGAVVCALGPVGEVTLVAVREDEPRPGTVLVTFPPLLEEDRRHIDRWTGA